MQVVNKVRVLNNVVSAAQDAIFSDIYVEFKQIITMLSFCRHRKRHWCSKRPVVCNNSCPSRTSAKCRSLAAGAHWDTNYTFAGNIFFSGNKFGVLPRGGARLFQGDLIVATACCKSVINHILVSVANGWSACVLRITYIASEERRSNQEKTT